MSTPTDLLAAHPLARAVLAYSAIRLGLFVGLTLALWVAGLNGWFAALLGAALSGVLALPLGRRQRDELAARWQARQRS